MARILYVANEFCSSEVGGRSLLCQSNYIALNKVFGGDLHTFYFNKSSLNGKVANKIMAVLGYVDGVNIHSLQQLKTIIARQQYDAVFVDGSNLGQAANMIFKSFPNVKIFCFFHNCEYLFFKQKFKLDRRLRSFVVMLANYMAERSSIKYSHHAIYLTNDDYVAVEQHIGVTKNHSLCPLFMQDRFECKPQCYDGFGERYILLVGGDFYSNLEGLRWFMKEVQPYIDIPLYVVGRGMSKYRSEFVDGNVKIFDGVEHLGPFYANALAVVAPIFSGSGMKTKVAEAAMHGKKVLGSKIAFIGYEPFVDSLGWLCQTAQDYVEHINSIESDTSPSFDTDVRAIFKKNYSIEAAVSRYRDILNLT